MTYIMLTDDMRLVVTKKDNIYRGDNMNKSIVFLLPRMIEDTNTADMTIFLSYIRPNGSPDIVMLERDHIMYNSEYYKYALPVTCKLSRYPGNIVMWLQFMAGDAQSPTISKSGECMVTVLQSKSLDNCFSDHQLMAIYQLKQKLDEVSDDSDWTNMTDESKDGESGDSSDYWEDM